MVQEVGGSNPLSHPIFELNFPHIAVGKAQVSLDWLHHGDALFSRAGEEACHLLIISI